MSDKVPEWYFPTTAGGPIDGFNDAAREHFEGIHEHFLAREIIQNSIDAKRPDQRTVRVVFEMNKCRPNEVPGLGDLRKYYEHAQEFTKNQEGATEFYQKALDILNSSEIMVLRVGDYCTKGLDGDDDDPDGNWARLVTMEGASSKKGAGGGSFGIGKNAAYAASALRAVYYVTRNSSNEIVFQGKAKISSFKVDDDIKQGTGLFGFTSEKPGSCSIRGDNNVPEFFYREEQGTDIYIAGYQPTEDEWRHRLIESVLMNFWAAIHHDDLVVEFKSEDEEDTVIDSSSLKQFLELYQDSEDNALPYYLALTETEPVEEELKHLGKVKLYVKTNDGFPRKIQLMRKPKMVVRTKRIYTLHENYAAVFICENEKGNNILRDVEPPAHDDWDENRKNGIYKPAFNELNKFLRETLRSFNPYTDTQPEDIPELGKYLPDIEERDDLATFANAFGENTNETTSAESPREVGSITPPLGSRPKMPSNQNLTIVHAARGSDSSRLGIANRTNATHNDAASDEEGGNLPRIDTSSFTFRSFATKRAGELEYHVVLNPNKDTTGAIKLMAVGEDSDYPVEIRSATDGEGNPITIKGAFVSDIELTKGQPRKLILKLNSRRRYALGVEAHEN